MKKLGPVKEYIGIQVTQHRAKRTLHLSQAPYAEIVFERLKMSDFETAKHRMVLSGGIKQRCNWTLPYFFKYEGRDWLIF